MSFLDVRLHVSVRPALEYKLPEAGRVVRGVLLGDAALKDGITALEGCLVNRRPADDADTLEAILPVPGEEPLQRLCAQVCTHARDYLDELAASWHADLQALKSDVRRITQDASRRSAEAQSVHARYRERAPRLVDDEYRIERTRVRRDLDEAIDKLRGGGGAAPARPAGLSRATEELKDALASAYGSIPTARLVHLKRCSEDDLHDIEASVADRFVEQVARLLKD